MPPALIKRCPREPFSKPESKESAYSPYTLTYISPKATWEKSVKLATVWLVDPSTSQEMTRFCSAYYIRKIWHWDTWPKKWWVQSHILPHLVYANHWGNVWLWLKPSQTFYISFSNKKNGGSVYPRDTISRELQASTIKCKFLSVLVPLWPHTLAATYPTVIGPITAHTYKVTKREPCQM